MKNIDLTHRVIGICMKVHSALGPGLLESVYEEAICYELMKQGIPFERQKWIHVYYDDVDLGQGFRADVIVASALLLELKSVENLLPKFSKITMTYLRFTGLETGLLMNFNEVHLKDGIRRLFWNHPQ